MANHWWLFVLVVALHATCGLSAESVAMKKPSRSKTLSSLLRMLNNLGVVEPGTPNSKGFGAPPLKESVPGQSQKYGPPAWNPSDLYGPLPGRPFQQYGAPQPGDLGVPPETILYYRPASTSPGNPLLPIRYGPPPRIPTQQYGAPLPRMEYGEPGLKPGMIPYYRPASTSSRNPFLPIRDGRPPAVPYQQSGVTSPIRNSLPTSYGPPKPQSFGAPLPAQKSLPISYGPPKPSQSLEAPLGPPISYGPPPAIPYQRLGVPSPIRNSLPVSSGPPSPYTSSESFGAPLGPPTQSNPVTVKQHLLNAIHHIVDAINVAPEDLLRQITSKQPKIASKIQAIEALLRSLPAGRLKLLRENPDVAAIMQQLGVRLPEKSYDDLEITIPEKPDHVDEGPAVPKYDLEVVIKPDGVEIVKPDEQANPGQMPSELEVTIKPNGVEIVIPEKPDHVDEGKTVESSEPTIVVTPHSVEIVVTDKPEQAAQESQETEIVVTPHSVVIEIPNKPDHVDDDPAKPEYDIPKGIEQLPLATVPANQFEVPEVPAPSIPKVPDAPSAPALIEVTTELSETVEFEVTPSYLLTAEDVPVLPTDAKPFLSDSFRKKLLQAVTKALREYQQKVGLTTRVPATQPPPKGKDEKLHALVQDTRSKVATMLKIIDKAAEDGKIPENLADEIDLNTPGILVQLSELEQLLGKDSNEPEQALPTKPDGTPDWGKILHGRDPPTGSRAPKTGGAKSDVKEAVDDADEE